ncbi:MAG: S9 family peptidase [Bdellovibrionaceae bacterium]|nr:S9 family peptidase [Pseudobdellovibrionaceae bacterium]
MITQKLKLLFVIINLNFLFLQGVGCVTKQKFSSDLPTRPQAIKKPQTFDTHGLQRIDNYYWLKERSNPQVLDYLKKENEYTEKSLSESSDLKEKIYAELKSRVVENEISAPYIRAKYKYSSRFEEGKQYPIYEREDLATQHKEILLDINKESQGADFFEHLKPSFSHDQNFMAYAFDSIGRRFYTIAIKNLKTNSLLPIQVDNTTGNLIWSKDNNYFFYTKQHPETLRSYQVYRFDISKNRSTLLYEEKDETFSVFLYENLARNHIFFISESTLTTEVHFLKSNSPLSNFTIFTKRKKGHEYTVYDGGDRFFIKSNDQALNFKVLEASLKQHNKKYWKEIIPHDPGLFIESLIPFKNFIAIFEKNNGLDKIKILDRHSYTFKHLQFKDSTYTVDSGIQGDYDKNILRYVFESMRQPEQRG